MRDCDYIFHHAAQAGVRKSWGRDFFTYIRNNIDATQRLLEAVKERGIGRIKKIGLRLLLVGLWLRWGAPHA